MAQILTELFHKALIVSWTGPKEANQMLGYVTGKGNQDKMWHCTFSPKMLFGFGRFTKGTSEIGNLCYQNRLDFGWDENMRKDRGGLRTEKS